MNREIVDLLIDRILVHNENDIEIIWNGDFDGDGEQDSVIKLGIFKGNADGTMDLGGALTRVHMAILAVRTQDLIMLD